MIPRVMNFFWGGCPMSFMRYLTLKSFRKHNPDWEMNLFQPTVRCPPKHSSIREQEDTEYSGLDYRDYLGELGIKCASWNPGREGVPAAPASDLFQWELLSTTGGFYSDMDVLYIRSLENTYQQIKCFDAVFCLEGGGMAIGFCGSSPCSPLFKSILVSANQCYTPKEYQHTGIVAVYFSVGMLKRSYKESINGVEAVKRFEKMFPSLKITCIPDKSIYPYDWITYTRLYTRNKILSNECIGVHWFGGAGISQEWNRKLTPENVSTFKNTFCYYAKNLVT